MSLKSFEVSLDRETPAERDVFKAMGWPQVFIDLYKGAKITVDTGNLEAVLRDPEVSGVSQLSPEKLDELLGVIERAMGSAIADFIVLLIKAAISDFALVEEDHQSEVLVEWLRRVKQKIHEDYLNRYG